MSSVGKKALRNYSKCMTLCLFTVLCSRSMLLRDTVLRRLPGADTVSHGSYHMLPDSEHGISSLRLALERAFTPQTLANASNPGLSLVDCLDEKSASHRNVDLGIFFSFSFVCV